MGFSNNGGDSQRERVAQHAGSDMAKETPAFAKPKIGRIAATDRSSATASRMIGLGASSISFPKAIELKFSVKSVFSG